MPDPSQISVASLLFQAGAIGVFVFFTLKLMQGWTKDRAQILDKMLGLVEAEKASGAERMSDGLKAVDGLRDEVARKLDELVDIVRDLVQALALHEQRSESKLAAILERLEHMQAERKER